MAIYTAPFFVCLALAREAAEAAGETVIDLPGQVAGFGAAPQFFFF